MARKVPARRRVARWLPWSDGMAALFRLAGAGGWRPPASVRLSPGEARMTLSARFTAGDGTVMTARIRLRRDRVSGLVDVVAEDLSIPLGRIGPRSPGAAS
jgi:hypothetical protein